MTLPLSRDYTAVVGVTKFPAATDQRIQDAVVAANWPNNYGLFRENWEIAPATLTATTASIADLAKRWGYALGVVDATQTLAFQNPQNTYGARSILLNQGTSNTVGHTQTMNTMWPIARVWSGMILSMEFDIQATTSTLLSREWHLGLSSSSGALSAILGFDTSSAQANWLFGNNGASTPSSVPVSIGGAFARFRFILDKTLATPAVAYYINGNLIGTDTANIPANGTDLFPSFNARPGTTGVSSFTIGTIHVSWTKF